MKELKMAEKILVLGASGTVGTAVYRQLSQYSVFDVYGTYFHHKPDTLQMRYFSVEEPDRIRDLLEEIAPDIVISALRGDFQKQVEVHIIAAEYLRCHQGKLLYFSTANVFDAELDFPHYENDSPRSDSEYGRFKILCENKIREILGNQAVILRLPFVFGKNSVRMCQIKDGCEMGTLDVYKDLFSNYAADIQIADYIEWIVRNRKEGIFHIGTTDIMRYTDFITRLILKLGKGYPAFQYLEAAGTMAVMTERKDIPLRLAWNVDKLIDFLCMKD